MNKYGVNEEVLLKTDKSEVEKYARELIAENGFEIVDDMSDKPWGMGFRFADKDLTTFLEKYYFSENIKVVENQSLSPKFLFIAPGVKLSWQYHHRRSELWKVIGGTVGVVISDSDEETTVQTHATGELITVSLSQRHRIVGLENWSLIAEIWQHSDTDNPSDEEDIVRISDEFGREGTTEKR